MKDASRLFELVDEAFRPEAAAELAASLTQYYRSPGSSGYLAATEKVKEVLEEAGLDSLEVSDYPVEGWEPEEASLAIRRPEEIELVDYESAPSCIAWWSDSTPPEGEQLEVVDVGTGEKPEDFEGKNVEGKAVFVHGTSRRPGWWEAAENAAEYGARGIITDYLLYQTPEVRTPELMPEATQLLRLPYEDREVWAFSISHNAAQDLLRLLKDGESVVVEAKVQAKQFSSVVRNVVGELTGTEEPEKNVLLCAHTSGIKPGGNCAEGPGMVAELARALAELIDQGTIDRPRRSIRFLICCEGAGTNNYLEENPSALEEIITTLTYCSSGHRQCETSSALLLYRSPDSVPSFVNDYLNELIELSPKDANWIGKEGGKELPLVTFTDHYYTPWSDNTRFAAEGLPAPLFMSWPDRGFHSQFLTEKVIDPAALRRCALVSGVAAVQLAAAEAAEASDIARLVARRASLRVTRVAAQYRGDSERDDTRALRHLEYLARRDIDSMRTVRELVLDDERAGLEKLLEELELQLRAVRRTESEGFSSGTEELGTMDHVIPVKLSEGRVTRWAGLDYEDLLEIAGQLDAADPRAGWRSLRVVTDETWNFVNGKRTVRDIADYVGFEFDLVIEPEPIWRILKGLQSEGYLEFREE
jgi:hypothetical protein